MGDQLLNDVVDLEARGEERALAGSNSLLADEAVLLYDQIFVDALGAKAVAANGGLALVDEVEAQRTDQALVVVLRFGHLAGQSACYHSGGL